LIDVYLFIRLFPPMNILVIRYIPITEHNYVIF